MKLNLEKTVTMRISPRKRAQAPEYLMNSKALKNVDSIRYLGVIITQSLSWEGHVKHVVSKANKALGMIMRVASGLLTPALLSLYKH